MPVTKSFKKLCGPLAAYLDRDRKIEEININGYGGFFFVHGSGETVYANEPQINETWCKGFIAAIESHAGKEISRDNPTMSARLFSGERVEIACPPAVTEPVISIRIPSDKVFALSDFTIPNDTYLKLSAIVMSKKTLLISGATRSGKTSFMSALMALIPPEDRILTIEDVPELNIPLDAHPNQVRLYFNREKPNQSAEALFRSGMRHNPDMISLAECRGGEALDFLSAANSGHYGMTTVHADNPRSAIDKMATLAAQGDTAMTHDNLVDYMSTVIDGVVQVTYDRKTQRRVVSDLLLLGDSYEA